MKICFVLQDMGEVYGAEQATIDLVRGLSARPDTDIHTALIKETRLNVQDSGFERGLREAGSKIKTIQTDKAFSRQLAADIRRYLIEQDIPITHSVGPKADIHNLLAVRFGKIAAPVSTLHGWLFRKDPKERLHEWINLWSYKRMNQVIVLSNFYQDLLLRKGVKADRLQHIPSGPKFGSYPSPARHEPFTMGILGRLSSEKNHSLLIRALAELKARGQNARLIIAGEGGERAAIETAIFDAGLNDSVELPGYLPRDEFFARIDLLVICSVIENLPYTVMEAMARSLPVVTTRVGGLPDLVEDGVTGSLIPLNDVNALVNALAALMEQPALAKSYGTAGHEKLLRDFNAETSIEKHIEIYQKVARV